MKLTLAYAYFFLALISLSGCTPPKIIKTEAPIDFQFVTIKTGDTPFSLAEKYNDSSQFSWRIEEFNNNQPLVPGQELIIPLTPFRPGGLRAQGYQLIPVLSYHNFSKGRSHNKLTVSAKSFRQQLNYIKNNGYHVITMDQLIEFIDFGQVPEKSILITIDDGWLSSYEIAYPLLKEFGFNATLFIPSHFIGSSHKKSISWEQIKEMVSDSTIDIQCHGKTHRDMSTRNYNESFAKYIQAIEKEIAYSTQTIYNKLGKQVTALAYPFGNTNPLVMEMLKNQGYKAAFTVKRRSNPFFKEPYLLNRSMIYGSISINKFAKNLKYFEDFPISKPEPIDTLRDLTTLALQDPIKYENKKQWRTARLIWKLRRDTLMSQRQALAISDPDSSEELYTLKKSIEQAQYKVLYSTYKLTAIAERYYLARSNAKHKKEAKKLMLQALLYNSDNLDPLELLQSNMGKLKTISYQVKKNDSFASIARKLYRDSKKSILIPLYNENIKNENDLVAGEKLSLPKPPINVKRQKQFNSKRCNIKLTKSSKETTNDYYSTALENFAHDQIPQAIENLKITICLDPKHHQAIEMLDMLKDL